jgi:hypothetical protein
MGAKLPKPSLPPFEPNDAICRMLSPVWNAAIIANPHGGGGQGRKTAEKVASLLRVRKLEGAKTVYQISQLPLVVRTIQERGIPIALLHTSHAGHALELASTLGREVNLVGLNAAVFHIRRRVSCTVHSVGS